jgi:hypothetical protein
MCILKKKRGLKYKIARKLLSLQEFRGCQMHLKAKVKATIVNAALVSGIIKPSSPPSPSLQKLRV